MTDDLLFVYGTLRRGGGRRMHGVLARGAELVDLAVLRGQLFVVASYPGVVRSDRVEDVVHGEVYRLREPQALLRRLDRYEGCDPNDPSAPYRRSLERVTLAGGDEIRAWVYLYMQSTCALRRIVSGDYLAR